MIDTKALRSRILELAIQGKLTEQLESDGTAEELWQQIQAEKQRLIKEGRISPKPVPDVTNADIPFDIPKGWRFVRFGDVAYIVRGGSPRPIKAYMTTAENGINWIKIGDVEKGGKYIFKTKEKIKPEGEKKSRRVYPGDFLLTNSMSFGRPYISKIEGCIHDGWLLIRNLNAFDVDFLYHLLSSAYLYRMFCDKASGSTVDNLNIDKVNSALIPLPPLAEQKRIVARVEEIFRILDTIDAAQEKYAADAESLKAKLITAGIQGKLTEQLESDGTAEELYQQIQAEKQRLIKEGKIKKEKPLPEIKPEEVPFEIPGNWKWVRLNEICKSVIDGDHQPPPQTTEGMPFIVISNLSNGTLDFSNTRHVSREYFDSLSNERIAEQGDILFTVTGSFGIPIKVETDQQFCFQRHIALLKQLDSVNTNYLLHVLKSEFVYKQCDDVALGVAQRTVGIKPLRSFLIPLPPLDEQKRIADKLDEVLSVLL